MKNYRRDCFRTLFGFLILALCFSYSLLGQENGGSNGGGKHVFAQIKGKIATLNSMLESIQVINLQIQQLEERHKYVDTQEQKSKISGEIKELNGRLSELQVQFTIIATGLDPDEFFEEPKEGAVWQDEVNVLIAPILSELKSLTEEPREIERLRNELSYFESRRPKLNEAIKDIDILSRSAQSQKLRDELNKLNKYWKQQEQEFTGKYNAVKLQLDEKENAKKSIGNTAQEVLRIFFRSRGRNLILSLSATLAIFFSLRFIHRIIRKKVSIYKNKKHQFYIRLMDVFYYVFTIAASLSGLMIVLYMSADWVLLGIVIIIIFALLWTLKNALPSYFEQAKLLLDLGAVREGERLIYNGVPFKVESMNLFTELVNPLLTGGSVRLPLKDLIDMRSRPYDENEAWFPTRLKDWVIMGDGVYGEIVAQTPEHVTVSTVRGSFQTYTVSEFLKKSPRNLTINTFACPVIFNIDYKYRYIVNHDIINKLRASMEEDIKKEFYGKYLVKLIIELKVLDDSSLGIITIGRFSGEAASEWTEIHWKLQQLALEAANKHGWDIPFPQLKIHKGGEIDYPKLEE